MNAQLEAYRTMLVIRRFEERVEILFSEGLIKGTAHPAIGQEATAVGVCSGLKPGDYITSTHRGHGHFIARGGDPRRIMAELFGKREGYAGGRGGSQLMADYSIGFLGSNGITGGGIPLATGVGLSIKQRRTDQVVACFFGDGAANQGTFHESLNMAGLWSLPVIYVCENNMYAMSTAVSASTPVEHIAERAAGYGMPGVSVDGNDLGAVQAAVETAAQRARTQEGPTLLECKTYRLSGHSRGDQRHYRTEAEERDGHARAPLKRMREFLEAGGLLDTDTETRILQEAEAIVDEAVAFAQAGTDPDPATLEEGVYA